MEAEEAKRQKGNREQKRTTPAKKHHNTPQQQENRTPPRSSPSSSTPKSTPKSHHGKLAREASIPKFEKSRSLTDMGEMFKKLSMSPQNGNDNNTGANQQTPAQAQETAESYQSILAFKTPQKQVPPLEIPHRNQNSNQHLQASPHPPHHHPESLSRSPSGSPPVIPQEASKRRKKTRNRPRSALSKKNSGRASSRKSTARKGSARSRASTAREGPIRSSRPKRPARRASSAMRTGSARTPSGQKRISQPRRANSVAKTNHSSRSARPASSRRSVYHDDSSFDDVSPRIIELSRSRAFYFESKKKTPEERAREEASALLEKYNALGPFITNLLSQLPEDHLDGVTQKILSQSKQAASIHMNRWYDVIVRQMLKCGICPQDVSDEELCFVNIISFKFEQIIRQNFHHQISLYHSIEPKAFIVGPRESGKTTALYLLTKMVAEKFLFYTNQFQSVLFLFANFEQIMLKDMNVESFYQTWVKLVIDALCAQRLPCAPFKSLLYSFFMKLTRQKRITTQFTTEFLEVFEAQSMLLTILGEKILHAFQTDKHDFMQIVAHFPKTIAEMFYFDRCIFVFDNFDYTFRNIPNGPSNSKVSTEKVSVYLKDALKYEFYLLSGQESATFLTALQDQSHRNRVDVDLLKQGTMIRTDGLITAPEVRGMLPQTVTTFDPSRIRESATKSVDISVFGGCPAYLAHVRRFIGAPRQFISYVPEESESDVTMNVDVVNSLEQNVLHHQHMVGKIGNEYRVASDVGLVESFRQ